MTETSDELEGMDVYSCFVRREDTEMLGEKSMLKGDQSVGSKLAPKCAGICIPV